ncbi:MAG: DUF2892 domain-containing protein [Candidatus Electrothrix aestuarii]|uniref:DUF2892 domain-containing protein n=1 Tax=Candidatus Electrothrix aestuarii TaxID=3062594 RepID=A0AAU8LU44_9BACT|nr:DUF2892 domain-containing protein [Candidatus Electrothrix aestuarii]
MIVIDWIHSIAGFLVIMGLVLGFDCGGNPFFVHPYFLLLSLLVGLNLFQSGFTKRIPQELLLIKLGVPESREEKK